MIRMKVQEEVFFLIQSLSKNEKQHFRMALDRMETGGRGGKEAGQPTHAAALYDHLASLDEYNESDLKKWYKEQGKNPRDLPSHKRKLKDLLLKHLRSYPEAGSVETEIAWLMQDARLLLGKEIYNWCGKVLDKAIELATESERWTLLLEALTLKRRMVRAEQSKDYRDKVEALLEQGQRATERVQVQQDQSLLMDRLLILSRIKPHELSPEERIFIDDAKNTLDNNWLDRESFLSHTQRLYCRALIARIEGNNKGLAFHCKSIVDLWDANPQFIKFDPEKYGIAVSNYLNSCQVLERYEDFPAYIERLREAPGRTPEQRRETRLNTFFLEILYHINLPDIEAGIAKIEEIELALEEPGPFIKHSRRLAFYQNICLLCFLGERVEKAWAWNDKILSLNKVHLREDVWRFAQLMRIVLDFETGSKYLATNHKKVKAALKKKGLNALEKVTLKLLIKLKNVHPDEKYPVLFRDLQQQMAKVPSEERLVCHGWKEIELWTLSKVERKSMVELMEKNRGEGNP